MSHAAVLQLIYLFICLCIFLSVNAFARDVRVKRQIAGRPRNYLFSLLGVNAKNNCNLIGRERTERLSESRESTWRRLSFSVETRRSRPPATGKGRNQKVSTVVIGPNFQMGKLALKLIDDLFVCVFNDNACLSPNSELQDLSGHP